MEMDMMYEEYNEIHLYLFYVGLKFLNFEL